MFGVYLPENLYKAVPIIFIVAGLWAIASTNFLGIVSGMLLIAVALIIGRMRRAASKPVKLTKSRMV